MSAQEMLAAAGPGSKSSGAGEPQAGKNPAQTDVASPVDYSSVYITSNSVIVATPEFTRIENTEQGWTHYGAPLPDKTRRSMELVAFYE